MWKSIIAICLGASAGALLRWGLGTRLNPLLPSLALGTLTANLLGAFVVGAAIAFFATYAALSPEWRLLVITGFCGGLTTFSTFSAEVTAMLQQGRTLAASATIAAHLGGSLLMTFAGIGAVSVWSARRTATPPPAHVMPTTLSRQPSDSGGAPPV
jgi:CrcB protein